MQSLLVVSDCFGVWQYDLALAIIDVSNNNPRTSFVLLS